MVCYPWGLRELDCFRFHSGFPFRDANSPLPVTPNARLWKNYTAVLTISVPMFIATLISCDGAPSLCTWWRDHDALQQDPYSRCPFCNNDDVEVTLGEMNLLCGYDSRTIGLAQTGRASRNKIDDQIFREFRTLHFRQASAVMGQFAQILFIFRSRSTGDIQDRYNGSGMEMWSRRIGEDIISSWSGRSMPRMSTHTGKLPCGKWLVNITSRLCST